MALNWDYAPSALEVNSFAHGQAELIKFVIPEGNILDGIEIAELRAKIHTNILVCGVERDGEVYIPGGDFILQRGDFSCCIQKACERIPFPHWI